MDGTVRYMVVRVQDGTWEFTAATLGQWADGLWRVGCDGGTCRMCPFRGGGCEPLAGGLSFPSREAAALYAATIGVEVWAARDRAGRFLFSDNDMERLT